MAYWAILSGIEGNLQAYEAVIQDLKRSKLSLEALYILGDVVGPTPESEKLVHRIRNPRPGELEAQVCQGWWEEQCLILHGIGRTGKPTQLIEQYGMKTTKVLWDSVSRETVQWISGLDFGFFELDCLLIHGTTVSVDDEITPETPPMKILDRLMRMGANYLFCGRSGLSFQYQIEGGSVRDAIATLDTAESAKVTQTPPRQAIGVGSVGRIPGQATYTLYHPGGDRLQFKTVHYGVQKGFQSR
jgi:hypothetical protein